IAKWAACGGHAPWSTYDQPALPGVDRPCRLRDPMRGRMRIRAPKDFWSGVMFCSFAAVAILAARGYSLGTTGRMGPGYFPLLLGFVLGALGVVLIARSFALEGEHVARLHILPLLIIAFAV